MNSYYREYMEVCHRPSADLAPLAIYIHWPFCKAKCPYCDFNSHVREQVDQSAWKDALLQELRYNAARVPNHRVTSIFFGGGTPSLMPPATAEALINEVHTLWPVDPQLEITLEANPTSVEAACFADFRAAGINRVSLGVQSLNDDELRFLGREHSAQEALEAVATAKRYFPRYSFDLIYARPNHTPAMWTDELQRALTHAEGHMSLYQLTIEENTAFYHAYYNKQSFALPDEDTAAALYETTQTIMDKAGMPAYEISNHAALGEASRHNLSYWRGESYVGIGPGAHGRLHLAGGRSATATLKSPERWLQQVQTQGHAIEEETSLSEREIAEEYMMMGLRLHEGIELKRVRSILNETQLAFYATQGLVRSDATRLYATPAGQLVLNQLIGALIAETA